MRASLTATLTAILVLGWTVLPRAATQSPRPMVPEQAGPRPGAQTPQMPPRDRSPEEATGAGRIRGRVVAADTGTPLRRAYVRLSSPELRDRRMTSTGIEGRYEFEDLPAGRYHLSASKGGYVTVSFGQRRSFERGRPIDVRADQMLDHIDFLLPRGSVIAGRIVDEFGEPVADVAVQVLRFRMDNGARRLTSAGRSARTDDLGNFRIFGLPPGQYYVSAALRTFPASDDDAGETTGYAATYYPGTPDPALAQSIALALGQEMSGVDFPLFAARTARVSGMVIDSAGRPVSRGVVGLFPRARVFGGPMFMGSRSLRIQSDGHFRIANVLPGEYTLRYFSRGASRDDREFALANVTVAGANIDGVVLRATTGAGATGVVVFQNGQPGPDVAGRLRIRAQPGDPNEVTGVGSSSARVNDDWTFELRGLLGPRLIRISDAPGWFLKEVLLGETDVTDTPVEFRGTETIEGLRVVLTNQRTELTGTVTGEAGKPVDDYTVIVFAEDRSRRGYRSRFVRSGRGDQRGVFQIDGLPPARYLAFATDGIEDGAWTDPELLARVEPYATRVTLAEGEAKSIALTLTPVP